MRGRPHERGREGMVLAIARRRSRQTIQDENTDDEAWWELENKASVVLSSPGYLPLYRAPILPTFVDGDRSEHLTSGNVGLSSERITKGLIVLCLVAIAVGIVLIGYLHFENFWMGIGVATMFLMLPYTVQMMGRLPHVLPAALLVWAVVLYLSLIHI